jgi:transposase InsO family protein
MIQSLARHSPVRRLCRLLEVSPSGYYHWCQRRPGPRTQANQQLLGLVRKAFEHSRQTYGSPRITRLLQRQHIPCSKNRVARLMRLDHLKARPKRPFRPRTTDSRHFYRAAPNRLREQTLTRLNQVWVADITYVQTGSRWIYLAAVMDLFSRRIVGWSLGYSLHSLLVQEALQQALADRRPAAGLLHHSDRGLQYASGAFQALLAIHQIIPSMSQPGNCYDNATMESFWSTLKSELIHRCAFTDLPQASRAINDYIENFYNPKRLHSALDFNSPVDFEQQLSYK